MLRDGKGKMVVVIADAKILILKQITTRRAYLRRLTWLLLQMQRY